MQRIDPEEVFNKNVPHKEEISIQQLEYLKLKEYDEILEVERVKKEGRY